MQTRCKAADVDGLDLLAVALHAQHKAAGHVEDLNGLGFCGQAADAHVAAGRVRVELQG